MELKEEKFHHLFGLGFKEKKERFTVFLRGTPTKQIFSRAATPPLLTLALGGAVGAIIGSFGGPKGTAVGVSSGVGAGFLVGSTYAGYQVRKEYKQWLKRYRCDEILAEFIDKIASNPATSDFICPLAKSLMHYPFKDPGGFNYERAAIESWVKKYGTSPKMGVRIKSSDLQPNYALMGRQAKFYTDLLEDETSQRRLSPIQRAGIQAILSDLQTQIQHCFEAENRLLYIKLINGEISRKVYSHKIMLMAEMLDDSKKRS